MIPGRSVTLLAPRSVIQDTTIRPVPSVRDQEIHSWLPKPTLIISVKITTLSNGYTDDPEAQIVVAVSRPPPVAVRRAHVHRVVVPGAAAQRQTDWWIPLR